MDRIDVIIPREGFPVETVAIVRAKVTGKVGNSKQLREAITAAVSEWAKSDCPQAKRAFDYAGDDFNIGDLACYFEALDCQLPDILNEHGVKDLEIEIADVSGGDSEWNFDTQLVELVEEDE